MPVPKQFAAAEDVSPNEYGTPQGNIKFDGPVQNSP